MLGLDGLLEKSLGSREFSLVISLYLIDMMVKPDTDASLVKGSRCLFIWKVIEVLTSDIDV